MPEPGYNDGDGPPLWIWVVGLLVVVAFFLFIQSC